MTGFIQYIGAATGIAWLLHYIIYQQKEVILHWGMAPKRMLSVIPHIARKYWVKLAGKLATRRLFVGEAALLGRGLSGRLSARYGTTVVGTDVATKTGFISLNPQSMAIFLLSFFVVIELGLAYRRNKHIFKEYGNLGKLGLEIFVIYSFADILATLMF
ncbi:MAG: hypothetical protein QF775_00205 [archaeon]|jgi:hypothetical protein|nr:hypothetical protein [Euryarchaeota archaeon]MDP6703891.1 hypothetical protein [archaeon]MDP7260838.1 hypothetical protein [archaeon]HIK01184.1 hypothetical protein [Candidatus Undinarchaeales archaeon ERR594346 U_76725]|tara:strand:- start:11490 stop:11966 length:477 start_codon:yes stop_codon:yes gene_type:complete